MSNRRNWLVLAVAAVILALILFLLFKKDGDNWSVSFNPKSEEPYGTGVLYRWFENSDIEIETNNNSFVNVFENDSSPSNILFIADNFTADSAESAAMLRHVERGNRLFISSNRVTEEFMKQLLHRDTLGQYPGLDFPPGVESVYFQEVEENLSIWSSQFKKYDSAITVGYDTSHFEFRMRDQSDYYYTSYNFWNYRELRPNFKSAQVVSYFNDDFIYHIRIPYGKGFVDLHTLPITFTNYSVIDQHGKNYVKSMLGDLTDQKVYYDIYNSYYHYQQFSTDQQYSEGPLKYILQHESLRWAYYLLLLMAVFYIIFNGKRKQRIIPVLAENKNTTLSYVHTLGELYFQNGSHKVMAQKAIELFLWDLRQRYGVKARKIGDVNLALLAERSGISQEQIEIIFKRFVLIDKITGFTDKNLMTIHQSIREFYHFAK